MFFFIFVRHSLIKKNAPWLLLCLTYGYKITATCTFVFGATKMIKSAVLPDEETWLQYPCEILKTFGTYEETRSKLPKYDNNDDAKSSNIENRGQGKRKKKPNTWKINSDSYSPSMITMPEPPTWIRSLDDSYNRTNKLKQSNNITTPVSQNKIRESTKSSTSPENNLTEMNLLVQDQLPTETNSDNCLSPPMFENDNESHNEENEQYQPSSSEAADLSHATIHLLQQQLLLVQQIVRGQQITNKLLTKSIMSNRESKPQSTIRQKYSEHFILPAKSVAEVCDIEEKLMSASRQLMISRLQKCGGRSQNDTTTLILRTLLTDHCASNCDFEGRNSEKQALKDLIMFIIVLDVTITGYEDVVRCRIKNWLRLAPTQDKYKNNK